MKVLLPFFILACAVACREKDTKPLAPPVVKTDDTSKAARAKLKAPIINVVDTVETKSVVVFVRDSAATAGGLSSKLSNIYNKKLPKLFADKKMKVAGAPMAWYKKQKAPFFFEAGIAVEKLNGKLPKGFFSKMIGKDSAFVAHFFGPAELTPQAYTALSEIIKDRKKTKRGQPYEIYMSNPFDTTLLKKPDLYKMQTDIVMPYK